MQGPPLDSCIRCAGGRGRDVVGGVSQDRDSFLDGRAMGKGERGQRKGCVRVGLRGSRACDVEEERRLGKDVCVCVCVCVCARARASYAASEKNAPDSFRPCDHAVTHTDEALRRTMLQCSPLPSHAGVPFCLLVTLGYPAVPTLNITHIREDHWGHWTRIPDLLFPASRVSRTSQPFKHARQTKRVSKDRGAVPTRFEL